MAAAKKRISALAEIAQRLSERRCIDCNVRLSPSVIRQRNRRCPACRESVERVNQAWTLTRESPPKAKKKPASRKKKIQAKIEAAKAKKKSGPASRFEREDVI